MANKIRLKRGDGAAVNAYTGPYGELVFNRDTKSIHIQDGVTEGGHSVSAGEALDVPVITSPLPGLEFTEMPIVTVSKATGKDVHLATQWQVATDIGFTDIVYDTGSDANLKSTIDLNSLGITFSEGAPYYVRARFYSGKLDSSNWSIPIDLSYSDGVPTTYTSIINNPAPGANVGYFGESASATADGNTLVVGDPTITLDGNYQAGRVYIHTRDENGLFVNTDQITPNDSTEGLNFGSSVIISEDGSILIVVAEGGNVSNVKVSAAIYFYEKINDIWTLKSRITLAYNGHRDSNQISLTADGQMFAITTSDNCAIYYRGSNGVWSLDAYVTVSGVTPTGCALNKTGTQLFMGVNNDNTGYVRHYVKVNGTWTYRAQFHVEYSEGYWGRLIKLSPDEKTMYLGNPSRKTGSLLATGAFAIFARSSADDDNYSWSKLGIISAPAVGQYHYFGTAIDVSADGNKIMVTESGYQSDGNGRKGRAYIYLKENNYGNPLIIESPFTPPTYREFGYAGIFIGDGSSMVIFAPWGYYSAGFVFS